MQEKLFMSCLNVVCALKNCFSKVYLKKNTIRYFKKKNKNKNVRTQMTLHNICGKSLSLLRSPPPLALSNRENHSFTFGAYKKADFFFTV